MGIIVSKFGGSSVADAACFCRIRDILNARKGPQYIILSAPGKRFPSDSKITDLLCLAHRLYSAGENPESILRDILSRFILIARNLNLSFNEQENYTALSAAVRVSRDHAVSRGEYICAKLFAEFMHLPFIDAASLIRFDDCGVLCLTRTFSAVRAMARRHSSAVIPGFYGSLPDGSVRTFPRGGSDITGALAAAALKADAYENWTDVDGLMSADPSVCPDAIVHPAVSYRQMQQISEAGAQVLHPSCLEPVRTAGIPTLLRNTFAPEKDSTYLSDAVYETVPCVCARCCRAVCPDMLGKEARQIIAGLDADIIPDIHGNELVLLKPAVHGPGNPVCVVTVFGLQTALHKDAVQRLHPLAALHGDSYSRYIVSPDRSKDAQRMLHALLLSSVTDSRTL